MTRQSIDDARKILGYSLETSEPLQGTQPFPYKTPVTTLSVQSCSRLFGKNLPNVQSFLLPCWGLLVIIVTVGRGDVRDGLEACDVIGLGCPIEAGNSSTKGR